MGAAKYNRAPDKHIHPPKRDSARHLNDGWKRCCRVGRSAGLSTGSEGTRQILPPPAAPGTDRLSIDDPCEVEGVRASILQTRCILAHLEPTICINYMD